jgi:hypothetical protein
MKSFAQDLRAVILEIEGSTEAACTSAVNVTAAFFPHVEVVRGTFEGEDHEWCDLEGTQFDVTADQFGGPEFAYGSLDGRWEGENEGQSFGRGCGNEAALIAALEARGWERA